MKSQTSLVAQQVRLKEWAEQIREDLSTCTGIFFEQITNTAFAYLNGIYFQ